MKKDPTTALVIGNFNILHPGHLRLFRFARECGDRLVVAVNSDEKAGKVAHVSQDLRLDGVRSNLWVDEAFITDKANTDIIREFKPNVVVKGKEHEESYNPELEELSAYGGKLIFSSGEATFSSIDLIHKEFRLAENKAFQWPQDYMQRHGITAGSIKRVLDKFSSLRVCVIGDLIIDEYITCQPLGMSQEDPSIVVTPIDSMKFIGGAGIVAAHGAGLGADVTLLSVAGYDDPCDFAHGKLEEYNVKFTLLKDDVRPTTLKQRFRSSNKTLLRVSFLHQDSISKPLQDKLFNEVEQIVDDIDLLVFSDFNYGCLPRQLVDRICEYCAKRDVVMVADSQSSSQIGDISRFAGMDLITPTEREARISLRDHESGLVVLAENLRRESGASNILLKLGEEGLLVHANNQGSPKWLTDRINALNVAPRDVAGAGDSLLIAGAMTLAGGGDIWHSACVGSMAAAAQISRVGNAPLSLDDLIQELPE